MTRFAGTVPSSVIAPLIRRWIDVYSSDHSEGAKNQMSTSYVKGGHEGHLEVLSFHTRIDPNDPLTGVSARQLRRILLGKVIGGNQEAGTFFVDHISFDTADRIVTAIDHRLWYREPLKQFYGPLEVTYSELKAGYELPEGFDWDGLPRPKKYLWLNAQQKLEAA